MGQVSVTISGKTYRMACEDGQEDHLLNLAARLNAAIEQLRARFGEIGDQRLTVMAAITLADHSVEVEHLLADAREHIALQEETRRGDQARQAEQEGTVARSLAALAERLEGVAARLGGQEGNG